MKIELIPLLKDNYAYLLTDGGAVAVVDPAEAGPVRTILEERGLRLDHIINTHHHSDHTGGNEELKEIYGCTIFGPAADAHRIAGLNRGLKEGDIITLESAQARVFETPGHTSGHICLYFAADEALFCGDTLFAMGCGRLFEGTATQMWDSLGKIMALPGETRIYCGHEYTVANGEFCLTIEPENKTLQARMQKVRALRAEGLPTIPSTLALEKETNVFLRAGSAERFAQIRALKDRK